MLCTMCSERPAGPHLICLECEDELDQRYEANQRRWELESQSSNTAHSGRKASRTAERDMEAVGDHFTDAGNARRFVDLTKGQIHYVDRWDSWCVYHQGQWIRDKGEVRVTELAKVVGETIAASLPDCDPAKWVATAKAAMRAESAAGIAGMVKLARGIDGVLLNWEVLDANPDILNVLNGTIDLQTGELRDHNPADLCHLQAPVEYDPDAEAPLWKACLETWLPDPNLREYVQREAGAATTGRHTETISVHYGTGANGKSKFFGALQHVLGPYACVPHKSLLVAERHEQHDTVKAALFRVRLAVASETDVTDRLNESMIKSLTGGDRISGRRMREDPWEFDPTHILVIASNHRPEVQGSDEGIWRRLRLVPWTVTIPEGERDPELHHRLMAEAPGILRWLVDGAKRYLAEGLDPPEAVRIATDRYRNAEDKVSRFLAETVVFAERASVRSQDIVNAHHLWWNENGSAGPAEGHWRLVKDRLEASGARLRKSNGIRSWYGVGLLPDDPDCETGER